MRLVKNLPNTITSMNLLCGVFGVIYTLGNKLELAFILMIIAAVLDFFDGFAARLFKAYSEIGKELDSLADLISFGFLPAIMLYQISLDLCPNKLIAYIPLILVVFSALRLAKFNIDTRQSSSFIGLATPASAMIAASIACLASKNPNNLLAFWIGKYYFSAIIAIILSLLLVSEIPMFALKFGAKKDKKNKDRSKNISLILFFLSIIVSAIICLILKMHWSIIPLISFSFYVLINIFNYIFNIKA